MEAVRGTELAQIFNEAADEIERRGWVQYAHTNVNGICAQQAIFNRARLRGNWYPAVTAFLNFVEEFDRDLPEWNDAEGRTKDEVVLTLRKAAVHYGWVE